MICEDINFDSASVLYLLLLSNKLEQILSRFRNLSFASHSFFPFVFRLQHTSFYIPSSIFCNLNSPCIKLLWVILAQLWRHTPPTSLPSLPTLHEDFLIDCLFATINPPEDKTYSLAFFLTHPNSSHLPSSWNHWGIHHTAYSRPFGYIYIHEPDQISYHFSPRSR